jgi:hypothetical protein
VSILQRVAWHPDERVDTPDLRAVDAFAANDWRYFISSFLTQTSQVIQGFDIANYASIFSTAQFQLQLNNVVILHPQATGQGVGFYAFAGNEPNQNPQLSAGTTNYIQCDLTTIAGAPDSRAFWDQAADSDAGEEYTTTVDTVVNLQLDITVNSTGFTPNTLPLYKVVTNSQGYVVSLQDCRNDFFRQAQGGNSPNPSSNFIWPSIPDAAHARLETAPVATTATSNNQPWQGGDKNLKSLKNKLDAITSIIKEIRNTPAWYMVGPSIAGTYQRSALSMLTGGKWQHIQGRLGHLALISGASLQTLGTQNAQTISAFSNADLTANNCLYALFPASDTAVAYGMGQDGATPIVPQAISAFTSTSITVAPGGNYPTSGGTILVHGLTTTYTAYNAGTGAFTGVSLDLTGFLQNGDLVYMLDTAGVSYLHASVSANVPSVVNGVSMGAERVLWLAYYPDGDVMFFRNGFAHQGEEIDVGEDADTTAQDKNIAYLPVGITTITNTTTGPNQVVTFQGSTPSLKVILPGAPGGALGLGGSLTLGQNQCAWITAPDRDAAFALASLANVSVGPIGTAPIDYNVFVIAYRLSDNNVYLWDRQKYRPGVNDGNYHKNQIYVSPQGDDINGDGSYGNPFLTWTRANTAATALTPAANNIVSIIGDAANYTEATGFTLKDFCNYIILGGVSVGNIAVVSGNIAINPAPGSVIQVLGINFTSNVAYTDTNTSGIQAIKFYGSNAGQGFSLTSVAGALTIFSLANASGISSLSLSGSGAHIHTDAASAPERSSIGFSNFASQINNVIYVEPGSALFNDSFFPGQAISDTLDGIFTGALGICYPVTAYLVAPPGGPTTGARYIVAVGATGAFAGRDGSVATWSGSAWVFDSSATIGDICLATGIAQFYQKSASNTWILYLTTDNVQNESDFSGSNATAVLNGIFKGSLGVVPPVIDYITTPPGSPTLGARYIVAVGGTGAWVGQDGAIATWNGTAWTFDSSEINGTLVIVTNEGNAYYNKLSAGLWAPFLVSGTNPTGTIIEGGWSTPPAGYLRTDGSAASQSTYANLFAAIGNNYGAGSGPEALTYVNDSGVSPASTALIGNATNTGAVYATPFTVPDSVVGDVTWQSATVYLHGIAPLMALVNEPVSDGYSTIGNAAFGGSFYATPFSVNHATSINSLGVWVQNIGATLGDIVLSIVKDGGGTPTGALVGTASFAVTEVTIGGPGQFVTVSIPESLAVGTYWIVVGANSSYFDNVVGNDMQVGLATVSGALTRTSTDSGTTWSGTFVNVSLAATLQVNNVPVAGNIILDIIADNGSGAPGAAVISSASIPTSDIAPGATYEAPATLSSVNSAPGNYWIVVTGDNAYFSSLVPTNGISAGFTGTGLSSSGVPASGQTLPAAWATDGLGNLCASVTAETVESQTFNLPDTRGRFTRDVDSGAEVDPDAGGRSALYSGGNIGDEVGSYQDSIYGTHAHGVYDPQHAHPYGGANGGGGADGGSGYGSLFEYSGPRTTSPSSTNISILSSGGKETRPINIYALKCIKY